MLNIGLYGRNGHQLPLELPYGIRARVTVTAAYPSPVEVDGLDALLADPSIDLISLCSPRRADQVDDAIRCLEAGKHVLAEKPGALTDDELDRILTTSARTGCAFREMADGSFLEPPVRAIRALVAHGALGTVVQVQAQKSYPWHDSRPQDFAIDGGLIRQAGIHGTRFIVGATGLKIVDVTAVATNTGNPGAGDIHIAASLAMTLANGAVASLNINYCNPRNFGSWGNEQLRVHGTAGMAESVDAFTRSRFFQPERESTALPLAEPAVSTSYLEHYVNFLLDGTPFPIDRDEEINALRAVIAAHQAAVTGEHVRVRD